jgi:uncharacterized LabA/DUF88 family protein
MFSAKTRDIRLIGEKDPEMIKTLESLLNEQTIVYIDFGNVSGWPKRLGWEIDLRRLKDFLDSFGVIQARFYFGTTPGNDGSARFMSFVHKIGYKVRTKPVKTMQISIDVSSVSEKSPDILNNFIKDKLLEQLKLETIEYLNKELKLLNKAGMLHIEVRKCNFDVEIATDMRVECITGKTQSFCLWSGDSDFADTLKTLLDEKRIVSVFGTARVIASELNELRSRGLRIFDVRKLREFLEKPAKAKETPKGAS